MTHHVHHLTETSKFDKPWYKVCHFLFISSIHITQVEQHTDFESLYNQIIYNIREHLIILIKAKNSSQNKFFMFNDLVNDYLIVFRYI